MSDNIALQLKGIGVSFGAFKAVQDVSMTIDDGELRVVLGANGAGKTTLMNLISGMTKSSNGQVLLFGNNITNIQEHKIARAGIGRKFQIPSVFHDLTVLENLRVAASPSPAVIRNLGCGLRPEARCRLDDVIALTELGDVLRQRAGDLSHGQMQWLELGMLIIQDARVILLDEPTAGMTQSETLKTSQIINRLRGQHTLLVVEHDMAFVREIAEQITVLHLGQVLAEGTITEIESNEQVRDAYLGSGGIH